MNETEEVYRLTFKGLLYADFGKVNAEEIMERIKTYMKRDDCNALILDDGNFNLEHVSKEWD